jgi:hypothetical protein
MAREKVSGAEGEGFQAERPSVSGEAARRYVEDRTRHLTASERAERHHDFNARLAEVIAAGRLRG